MQPTDHPQTSLLMWDVATSALQGQVVSGDLPLVQPHPRGVLVAVVDGLGHGEEAAAAAEIAVAALREGVGEPVVSLLRRCHTTLLGTRGVVMSLASFRAEENTMEWAGVGDVEGVLIRAGAAASRAREYVPQRGGIVGFRLPPLQAAVVPVTPGDMLIFATDGISRKFTEELVTSGSPTKVASRLLTRYAKGTDDALVLVASYRGDMS